MRAVRDLELTSRQAAHEYIRAAREAGHSWHDIGTALELHPNADGQQAGDTASEAAFTYATCSPTTEAAWRYSRSSIWTCPSCDKTISDLGPCNGPADDERGHVQGCRRLEATTAAHDAEWAALDAEREAGA